MTTHDDWTCVVDAKALRKSLDAVGLSAGPQYTGRALRSAHHSALLMFEQCDLDRVGRQREEQGCGEQAGYLRGQLSGFSTSI